MKHFDPFEILGGVNQKYAVVKLKTKSSRQETFRPGSDIDILCSNRTKVARQILMQLNQIVDHNTYIDTNDQPHFTHIDVISKNQLLLRFDLFERFYFRKFYIRPDYPQEILLNRVQKTIAGHTIFTASEIDDAVVRQLTLVDSNYAKIHHQEFLDSLDEETRAKIDERVEQVVSRRWWWAFDHIRHRFKQ